MIATLVKNFPRNVYQKPEVNLARAIASLMLSFKPIINKRIEVSI